MTAAPPATTFTFDDVVTAFLCAADAPLTTTDTFNVGTGVETTVTELHQMIAAAVGVSPRPDHAEARTGEVHASALDPTLAGQMLGWKPDTTLPRASRAPSSGSVAWPARSIPARPHSPRFEGRTPLGSR